MATLAEIRAQHPQYSDMSDEQLADGLHKKFYSDIPRDEFNKKIGMSTASPPLSSLEGASATQSAAADGAGAGSSLSTLEGASATQPAGTIKDAADTVGDFNRFIGQGVSFGTADEIFSAGLTPFEMAKGAITGQDSGKGIGQRVTDAYGRAADFNRGMDKEAKERSPIASAIGETAGAVLSAGGLAKQGFSLLNAARPSYPQMIGRGAVEGAGYGAVHGAGTGEGLDDRAGKALGGAVAGAVTGGAFGAVGARVANKAAAQAAPTLDDLRAAANAAYKRAEDAGVVVNPKRYDDMVADLWQTITREGVDPTLHPGVMGAFKRLDELRGQPVAFKTLDILRRVASSAGKNLQNLDERRLSGLMVEKIDDLMGKLSPRDVVVGDGAAAGAAIKEGRELWSRMRKSQLLENVIEKATDRVGANYTAAGFQTAIRQELKGILRSKQVLGFSKDERDMIRSIVRGASPENFLRHVGKLAPRGIVGATMGGGAGYALGGPAGAAAVWGVGEGAKRASSAMTQRKLGNLISAVRNGGPRALNALSPKSRSMLDAAIAAGEVTMEELGLTSLPATQPVGMTP